MLALLPPSSSVTRFTCSAQPAMIRLPTAVEPVNAILRTSGCCTRRHPSSGRRRRRSAGHLRAALRRGPARRGGARSSGVVSAGLSTTVLPQASAGPSFHAADQDREVPGRDRAHDTDRLVERHRHPAGDGDRRAGVLVHAAGVVVEHLGRGVGAPAGGGERHPHRRRVQDGQLVGVGGDRVRQPAQQTDAVGRRHRPPRPQRAVRTLDGGVDIGRGRNRLGAERLGRRRVEQLDLVRHGRHGTVGPMATPVVMIVGRTGPEDVGFRGGSYRAGVRYLDAISRAGGAGVIAPPAAGAVQQTVALLDRVDAVVLHGGGDIDPACYGQPPSAELYGVAAVHDEVELAVCVEALRRDLPVLAICRGLQVVDVVLGGTLRQHIGEDHRMRHHDVTVVGGSRLGVAVGPGPADRLPLCAPPSDRPSRRRARRRRRHRRRRDPRRGAPRRLVAGRRAVAPGGHRRRRSPPASAVRRVGGSGPLTADGRRRPGCQNRAPPDQPRRVTTSDTSRRHPPPHPERVRTEHRPTSPAASRPLTPPARHPPPHPGRVRTQHHPASPAASTTSDTPGAAPAAPPRTCQNPAPPDQPRRVTTSDTSRRGTRRPTPDVSEPSTTRPAPPRHDL